MGRIYGKVSGPRDIERINCIIRDEMLVVQSEAELTDLKKRSDYLCTLTFSPMWKKRFGAMIEQLREVALIENRVTVRLANYVVKYHGWDKVYDPWGKDNPEIEKLLDEIPQEVLGELETEFDQLKFSIEILEEIRTNFCEIRKGMVLAKDANILEEFKRKSDLLVAITHLPDFKERFHDIENKIEDLVHKEEERTVKLANIISTVNGWNIEFHRWSEDEIDERETIEQYVQRLLEEEQKADQYIPTEAKYRQGVVKWLVYRHTGKGREYAKRIYFSGYAHDFKVEGPGEFENRFGRKVWGVKIIYKTLVRPTVIHKKGVTIHLPQRVVTRSKVIELPREAADIKLLDQKPESAYNIA